LVEPVKAKPVIKPAPIKKVLPKTSKPPVREKSVARKETSFEEVMGYGNYEDLRDIGFNITDSWKND
jgi:hypothetical protein